MIPLGVVFAVLSVQSEKIEETVRWRYAAKYGPPWMDIDPSLRLGYAWIAAPSRPSSLTKTRLALDKEAGTSLVTVRRVFDREYEAFLKDPSQERTFRAATLLWQYGRALTASGADTYADQTLVFRQGYVGYRLAEFWPTDDREMQRVRCLVEAGFVLRPEPLPLVRRLFAQDSSDRPIERLLGATLAQTKHFADLAEAQRHADRLLALSPKLPSYLGLNSMIAHARFNITHVAEDGQEAIRRTERFRAAIGSKTPFGQLQTYIIDLTQKKMKAR